MGGLAENVKNGIAAVVEIATTLVKNVDQNQSLNRMKKITPVKIENVRYKKIQGCKKIPLLSTSQ